MAEESNVSEREPEALRAEVDETKARLVDKLQTLEHRIVDSWQDASTAVAETVENVKATVETTVHAVQGAVHDSTEAMGRALDLPAHVRRHPWFMLGGALLLGVVAGHVLRGHAAGRSGANLPQVIRLDQRRQQSGFAATRSADPVERWFRGVRAPLRCAPGRG